MNETNDSNFSKNVLENELPVVVDFWAEWCGPCKMLMPVFEELSHEYDGKIDFVKANTEENQTVSEEYGVMSIPCLIFFKNGVEQSRLVGARRKEKIKEELDKLIN